MCEKCNNESRGERFGVLINKISEYILKHKTVPTQQETIQMILSDEGENQQCGCGCCNNEIDEVSFEQCVEVSAAKIKQLIKSLESEYGNVIVSHAIHAAIEPDDVSEDVDHIIDRIGELEIKLDSVLEHFKNINFVEDSVCEFAEPIHSFNPSIIDMMIAAEKARKGIKDIIKTGEMRDTDIERLEKVSKKLKKAINKCYPRQLINQLEDIVENE